MFYVWIVLAFVLRRPLIAGLIVLAIWLSADRAWFRRTSVRRWFERRRTLAKLRAKLDINPHDRDARFSLADLLVEMGGHDEALGLLQRNIAAGDDDVETLWVAGKAAFGSSHRDAVELGEDYLSRAREKQPGFRSGAIDLELGRGRLRRELHEPALDALETACKARPGSVEVLVLLSRVHAALGASDKAVDAKRRAWQVYRDAPRFKRRQQRTWAWKANPIAAVRHYGLILAAVVAAVLVLPRLVPSAEQDLAYLWEDTEEEGWNLEPRTVSAERFTVKWASLPTHPAGSIIRWDLNGNGVVDLRRKVAAGDLYCRLLTHYPELSERALGRDFEVVDSQTAAAFGISLTGPMYVSTDQDIHELRDVVLEFEALLESQPPVDCELELQERGFVTIHGVDDGEPFQRVRW